MARARRLALIAASAALAAGSLAAAGCGGDDDSGAASDTSGGGAAASDVSGTIAGAGASSQDAAMEAWIAGFQQANPGATISYDPVGSGGGREQFVAGGTVFGGTDAHLADEELTGAQERCGGVNNLIEIPVYVSPIAVAYNLPGVEGLNLSAETLAKIMKREITKWNDPAIAADNPDASLPDTDITTVSRSDESGTTENFQEYLKAAAPSVWTYEVDGNWPVKGGEAAQGTSGVVDAISAGEGTIGYADASQVADLGVANIGVGGTFVPPSPEAAAAILEESPQTDDRGDYVFTYDLKRDTTAEGVYPIVLVSYEMACTQYSSAQDAAVVKPFLSWIISTEGQQAAASAAGSAPLSPQIQTLIQPAVDAIQG
ncbi:MAG TPA: phosphate ABC transporter substrate-binding protein PstS [Miltoncostaeaceae bacterium]|nr:phosphate ABC transporter substrate-binding protein PstS [Miltoncostaeaceae bacterium]